MKRMPLEIFRAGRHTAMSGEVVEFTEADLAQIAAVYNPKVHEAPLVLGHPRDNAPAYGWAQKVTARGSSLFAAVDQLEPSFAEAVREGRYKKVSASFYKPSSPANPTPGKYYLRHIGFLGAQPPAVKGLTPVEFAGSDADCLTLEFADLDAAALFRSLRDWIIEKYGLEEADKALPAWSVDWVTHDAVVESTKDEATNLAEVAGDVAEEVAQKVSEPAVEAVTGAVTGELVTSTAEAVRSALKEKLVADLVAKLTAALGEGADAAAIQTAVTEAVQAALEPGDGNLVNGAVEGAITETMGSDAVESAVEGAIKAALEPALETAIEAHPAATTTVDNSEPRARKQAKTPAELELERREERVRQKERDLNRAEYTSFVEGVLREGRRFPISKALTIDLLEHLGSSEVSFGEGTGKKSPLELVKLLLAKAPKEIEFRELGGPDPDLAFGEDADPHVVARAAEAYQAEQRSKGIQISTSDAVNFVKGRK